MSSNYLSVAGIILGLFWVVKYLFVILGEKWQMAPLVSSFLNVGTPILLYHFLFKLYVVSDDSLTLGKGIRFAVILFLLASFFEAVIVFAHIQYINPNYLAHLYDSMLEMTKSMSFGEQLADAVAKQPLPTPMSYIVSNVFFSNILLGALLSLIVTPMVSYHINKLRAGNPPASNE